MNVHVEFILTDDNGTRIDMDYNLDDDFNMSDFTEKCISFARAAGFLDKTIEKYMDADGL